MYLSLTPFNAHLDDGPTLPLARWLKTIGPDLCLLLREVNIWDLHMLNGTLHGIETTQRMLEQGTKDGEPYVLRPVGREVFHRSWYLKDIILPLQHSIGLGLMRFCIEQPNGTLKQTSHFALTKIPDNLDGSDGGAGIAGQFGLSAKEGNNLLEQLAQGRREIRLLEGRRAIILKFDAGLRLMSMRQEFISREEEFFV